MKIKSIKIFQILLALLILFLIRYIIISEPHHHQNHFVYYVPENDQPNCVVGAFCMYANEVLKVKISPLFLETNSLTHMINKKGVDMLDIIPLWNKIFPNKKIWCVYDVLNTNTYNNHIDFNTPYIWLGKLKDTPIQLNKLEGHACLVYLHSNSVTYKHFVYNPYTKTNYMVTTDYAHFFSNTISLYTVK